MEGSGFCWCCKKKEVTGEVAGELEEVDLEAEERKRQLAREGWAKVKRKVLHANRFSRTDASVGISQTKNQPKKFWQYSNYIILPNSMFKNIWRVIVAFLLVYHLMIFPYRFAFESHSNGFQIADGVLDIFFFFDFTFHFFFSYVDKRQRLVNTFKPIFLKYAFGTMAFDFCALYPYYFASSNTLYWLKMFRYFRLFEMLSGVALCLDELFLKLKNNMNFALSITRIIR